MRVFYLKKLCLFALLVLTALMAKAQTGSISGKVLDETGLPLPGASVQIKSLNKSTLTTPDGAFKITGLTNGAVTLTISYVGYVSKQQSVTVNGSTIANFGLKPNAQSLDEIVVVGYGTQTRREVTGSIAKVTGDKLTAIPTPSFEASLQGQAPGVQVTQGSGLAGSGSVIRIRGIGSISAGGDPLYVVDGIPIVSDPFIGGNRGAMNQNPLATINPNDIESVEVLKDAAAAGIYGSRGANGVILVTTKRGKLGDPTISLSTKYGLSTYANKPKFVSGPEWLQLYQEAWANDGNTGLATPLPGGLTWAQAGQNNTDWWGLLTQTGHTNDQSVSYSQGTDKIKAFISANYSNNESFLKGNSYERYGFRTNLDIKATSYLTSSINVGYDKGTNTRVNAAWGGGLGDAMSTALPIFPVYNEDGSYFNNGPNPVKSVNLQDWKTATDRLIAGITLDFRPVKNLSIKGIANMDNLDIEENQFQPAALRNTDSGYANSWPVKIFNSTFTGTANYDLEFNEKNKLSFLVGIENQVTYRNWYPAGLYGDANGPFNKDTESLNKAISDLKGTRNFYETRDLKDTFASLFSRINYSYDNKYYLQALVRRDGSSKFGPNNKYGYFPAVSASWYISQESFLKDSKVLSNLKLRTSYGLVGSSGLPSSQYYANYSPGSIYNGNPSIYPANVANPDLKWEEAQNFDLGIDFGFFNNRISGEFSYYHKKTRGALLNGAVPPSSGFLNGWINVGEMLNDGIELGLSTINIQTENFKWVTRLNISKNRNKVVSLGEYSPDAVMGGTNDTRLAIGYPLGVNYLVRYKGVDPADGLPIWLNKDGYETKTFSLNDRVITGQVLPDYVGGLTNTFSYKGFELNTLFTFAIGGNLYDGSAKRQLGIVTNWNIRSDISDRWQKPGDIARFPRLTLSTNTYPGLASEWQYNSTMFLYDATFVRLREVTLSYNLPVGIAHKLRLQNLKVFTSGMNLLTFSKYPGGDPEVARDFENPQDRNMSPNVTYLTTPQQKSLTFGLSTSF